MVRILNSKTVCKLKDYRTYIMLNSKNMLNSKYIINSNNMPNSKNMLYSKNMLDSGNMLYLLKECSQIR